MKIGDYKQRAQVMNPAGYGYETSGGVCFLEMQLPGKLSIFSHTAAALPTVTFTMWKRRDLTAESVLYVKGGYYPVTNVADLDDGKLTVYAVHMPLYKFSASGAYIGEIPELWGLVGEKYRQSPEDEFHAEEEETNVLLTNKAVMLSLGDLLTRDDGTVWTVKRRYTSGMYRNEYEVTRYGTAE